jgi:hypothetical protein
MGAIGSYPLDADGKPSLDLITQNGVPAGGPSSCAWGPPGAAWEDIVVANGLLYAAYFDRVMVYGIEPAGRLTGSAPIPNDNNNDGNIEPDETTCPTYSLTPSGLIQACIDPNVKPRPDRPDQTCPFSSRTRMAGAVGLVVEGTTLITSLSQTHLLLGFLLDDTGNFPAFGTDPAQPTKKEKKQERKSRKKNKTNETIRYIGVTLFHPAEGNMVVYGAGYSGRTDSFRLRDDGTLPNAPGDGSQDDFSTTPRNRVSTPVRTTVGMTAQGRPILYVAGGELDRVQAFRLFPGGLIDAQDSPAQTSALGGSYPNDVALVDVSSCN